ncbi:copper homeostasis protein CutC [Porphyromonas somerae]|uniref:copper homeostasis protein CutC n=1 Tax=Porphyromonas somerae TaxID=322095 RepID=UPI002A755A1C|nr:copper homeostasis protein CutC [Porphyromonas somerae]MDY3120022.1 copper homeostasis protein CutC [Porphyromonas somerae]
MITIEACVDSVASAIAAERGGAHRLELCASLAEGGTTPSLGMFREVVTAVKIPVFPIIRPRGGDFVYTTREVAVMVQDIEVLKMVGAAGFSLGALTEEGELDWLTNKILIKACGKLPVTLHRAFDRTENLQASLEVAKSLGFRRVLTSGGETSAPKGVETLAQLVKQAGKRITIVAGAGITPDNAAELIRKSKVKEIHGTFSSEKEGLTKYRRPAFTPYYQPKIGEYSIRECDEEMIATLIINIGNNIGNNIGSEK